MSCGYFVDNFLRMFSTPNPLDFYNCQVAQLSVGYGFAGFIPTFHTPNNYNNDVSFRSLSRTNNKNCAVVANAEGVETGFVD